MILRMTSREQPDQARPDLLHQMLTTFINLMSAEPMRSGTRHSPTKLAPSPAPARPSGPTCATTTGTGLRHPNPGQSQSLAGRWGPARVRACRHTLAPDASVVVGAYGG